ncbi:hypothetical protein QOL99_04415 [Deinococcus sp. MIMF12]|uniref:Uncharacterized protein n=1 Tax=Deinococcus rhizophilus TaxID=3049544 RepID=A0ABT7JEB3_9DEIO|nr:hypothetical protein [Deinococcus rhizophilus]MDL2343393.1 hypothetical protein [Deinococcus rhizophilus]
MTQRAEDRFAPQLLKLEQVVMQLYAEHPSLTDAQVDAAYEELARLYRAEATAHAYRPGRLDAPRQLVHDALLPVAEALRGRPAPLPGVPVIVAEDLRVCFARLRSSIRVWHREGRQAYLNYLARMVPLG